MDSSYFAAIAARLQEVITDLGQGEQDAAMLNGYAALVLSAGEDATLKGINAVWAMVRVSQGWTYGPAKDNEAKISPYLVPFEQLSAEIVDYDRPFLAAVAQVAREYREHPERFA